MIDTIQDLGPPNDFPPAKSSSIIYHLLSIIYYLSSIIYHLSSMPQARYSLFLALAGHDYFINHYSFPAPSFDQTNSRRSTDGRPTVARRQTDDRPTVNRRSADDNAGPLRAHIILSKYSHYTSYLSSEKRSPCFSFFLKKLSDNPFFLILINLLCYIT